MSKKRKQYVILGSNVIAVAVEGAVKDWAAYIDAVPGIDREIEIKHVLKWGDKLREDVARVLFPKFHDLRWRP